MSPHEPNAPPGSASCARSAPSPAPPGWSQALARLDRRGFLRLAGGMAAAGLLPTGCGGVPPELAPPADLRILSPRGYATLNAAAVRLLGPPAAVLIRSAGSMRRERTGPLARATRR